MVKSVYLNKQTKSIYNIRVDLLVSIKGFHEEGFYALQGDNSCDKDCFEHQVSCLEN